MTLPPVGLIGALTLALACTHARIDGSSEQAATSSMAGVVLDSIALDSCARLDRNSRPQNVVRTPDDALPPPHPGSWSDTRRVVLDSFSLDIPRGAEAGRRDHRRFGGGVFHVITGLPSCRYDCSLAVDFLVDVAGMGLDAYVAGLQIDSSSPNHVAHGQLPGPARAVKVDGSRGMLMDTPCGDCTSGELLLMRNRTIARVEFSLDAREGYQPGLVCRLERVATSFRWLDPP